MIRSSKYMIKRIIIGIGIAIGVMCFKNYVSFAATIESLQIDYSNMSNSIYYFSNANQEHIYNFIGMGPESPDDNLYVNTLFCVLIDGGGVPTGIAWANANDPQSFTGWGTRNSITTNITNVPCTLAGTSYRGKVVQVTGITRTGQDGGGDIYYTFRLSVNQQYSISLLNYSIASTPYELIVSQTDYTSQLNDMSNAITTTINNMSTIINNSLNNNQAQTNQWLQKVEAAAKAMKEAMENDDIDDSFNNSKIGEIAGKQYGNASISDIVLLPVKLLQSGVDGLSSNSCSDITLGNLYGTDLTFTCISSSDMNSWLGSTLYTIIDILLSYGVILGIRKLVLKIYNIIIFLKEGGGTID